MTPRLLSLLAVGLLAVAGLGVASAEDDAPGRYTVGLRGPPGLEPGDRFHGGVVVTVNAAVGFVVVEARDGRGFEQRAERDPHVRYLEGDPEANILLVPGDPGQDRQWAWGPTPGIDAHAAWDTTLGSRSVLVAVLDTGVDTDHPDLAANLVSGRDFIEPGAAPEDCHGHGTHTAGTVGAVTDNGLGVAGTAQVSVLPGRVLDCAGGGTFSGVANAITWAADSGASVISLSLGCNGCFHQATSDALAYASDRGVLSVCSAGNYGPEAGTVGFPASDANCLAVSNVRSDGTLSTGSSRGPEVELAAPGTSILSTYLDGGYASSSGTSMAAPHVAGVAGLALSVEPSLSAAALRQLLRDTAVDTALGAAEEGSGIVNAAAAVAAAKGGNGPSEPSEPTEPSEPPEPTEPSEPPNSAPVASFTFDCAALACDFDTGGSSDPDGTLQSHHWDFGDGATAHGATARHDYAASGTYAVTLTVTDDAGASGSETRDVAVEAEAPGTMHVHAIDAYRSKSPHTYFQVRIHDDAEAPVAAAATSVTICKENGPCISGSADTGSDGRVEFKWRHGGPGTYTTCVVGVTHAGLTWDGGQDHLRCRTQTV